MTNGIFKSLGDYGYARAINVMSTQSPTDFEWSVKLIGGWRFCVGVASRLERINSFIVEYDQNAILYRSWESHLPDIQIGKLVIHGNVTKHQLGDIIRFRFQPHAKKLLIDLVRILDFPWPNSQFKNGHWEIDLKDNVDYFPVVQCTDGGDTIKAHLVT